MAHPPVAIIMGSQSDWATMRHAAETLEALSITHDSLIVSAHPSTPLGRGRGVVVGINSTYRGSQLAQLIDHTDCQILVTSTDLTHLLDGAEHGIPADRVLIVDTPEHQEALAAVTVPAERAEPDDDDLYLLIFTSGSTGLPKGVTVSHRAVLTLLMFDEDFYAFDENDVTFAELPTNIDSAEDADALRDAVRTLPAGQRRAIELLKFEGLSLKEAASVTGSTESALKVATHRAIATLRHKLGQE